jgi:hypothetical protein
VRQFFEHFIDICLQVVHKIDTFAPFEGRSGEISTRNHLDEG